MVEGSLEELVAQSGIPYPNPHPYTDVTLLVVAWNESERIGKLLEYLKEYFVHSVVCVQESSDDTFAIAASVMNRLTDKVITDRHWGHGDASFPRMVKATDTKWAFVVSCDEWPTRELLDSMWTAIAVAQQHEKTEEAVWFPFHSWIDDLPASESGHLRLFQKRVGWPNTLHSRPATHHAIYWPYGAFEHRRSLDEMVRDYLSYYKVGRGHESWDAHNLAQLRGTCEFVATHKGWDYVTAFDWWPEVKDLAFGEEKPWESP
jgi:hypothetical protein